MRKTALVALCVSSFVVSCTQSNSPASGLSGGSAAPTSSLAGARVDKPFSLQISGAQCYSGKGNNAGDVAFGFPSRGADSALKFTIGPLRDGLSPGQENNKRYAGPSDYPNVGIFLKAAGQKPLAGYAVITVNADEQSGTFRLPDGSASGTWDCGQKLER